MNKKWFLFGILIAACLNSIAQEPSYPNVVQDSLEIDVDIFADENPAEITLIYNIKEYQKNKYSDDYISAELIYHLGDSMADRHQTVRIKARGNNRRERCSFPPLWINIKKSDIHNKQLKDTKKIKLVTHCGGNSAFEPYVLKEFLAYKIYNVLSPFSFRVRLVRLNFIDTGRKNKVTVSWGILIEPEEMLAERLNMIPIENDNVSIQLTDTLWTNYMAIFQYMIGNADYSVEGRHNVKLLRYTDFNKPNLIPVPYDFDYTGIVDAFYAIPGENLGITSVKDRYFLGPCRPIQDYLPILDDFQGRKEEIYQLINSFEYLSEKERKGVTAYLDEFFNYTDKVYFIESSFLSTCRE
jgi:hypothetical protein